MTDVFRHSNDLRSGSTTATLSCWSVKLDGGARQVIPWRQSRLLAFHGSKATKITSYGSNGDSAWGSLVGRVVVVDGKEVRIIMNKDFL